MNDEQGTIANCGNVRGHKIFKYIERKRVMNEKDFLATLIAYLETEEEYEILDLMKISELSFNYTNVFASKSYQFRAYVDIRVPIPKMKKLKEHAKTLFKLCGDIFIEDEEYALYGVDIKPMLVKSINVKTCIEPIKTYTPKISQELIYNISEKSIHAIANSITGDNMKSFYRSGYDLVMFFNRFGYFEIYEQGFPSRKEYATNKLIELNSNGKIKEVVENFLDPRDFIDSEFDIDELVGYINKFLFFDKLMIIQDKIEYKLVEYKKIIHEKSKLPTLPLPTLVQATTQNKRKLKLFFSYSHTDENMRNELEKHLVMLKHKGMVSTWHDRVIHAGTEFESEIDENLKDSDIILLLVSVDFLASNYCYNIEMKTALKMHDNKNAVVVPVILRNCDWHNAPFSKLMAVPTDGKSVTTWADRDSAYLNIAKNVENVAKKLIEGM